MIRETEIIKTSQQPDTQRFNFCPTRIFCFSATAQMAHLQNRSSQHTSQVLQKSHFCHRQNERHSILIPIFVLNA